MTNTRRSGKSLIELVVVITVMGAVAAISGKTMAVVLNKERSARDAYTANSARSQFAGDFRRDVNAAQSAELAGEDDNSNQQIVLSLPDDRLIEYRLADGKLSRVENKGGQVLRRESYHLGHDSARFGVESAERELVFLTMTISNRLEKTSALPRQLRIEAITGKDLRFQTEDTP